jgi:predicted phosphodiesterase
VFIYILHNVAELDLDPAASGYRVVVSGHSHRPLIEERAGVVFINPGSAGPRRFTLPVCVGELLVNNSSVRAQLLQLSLMGAA